VGCSYFGCYCWGGVGCGVGAVGGGVEEICGKKVVTKKLKGKAGAYCSGGSWRE